ncbi:complex I subunit 4 family protein [Stetteria hydrogenophila]
MEAGSPVFWASVLLPVAVGFAAWLAGPRGEGRVKAYAAASLLSLALPMAYVVYYAASGALSEGVLDPLYFRVAPGLGTVALALDALSAPVVFGVSLVTAIVALYSVPYMRVRLEELKREGSEPPGMGVYFLLYNLFAASMLGMALSTNLVEFYVFMELTLVASFLLIAYYGYGERGRIALLYFIWTHVGAVILLAGIVYYGIKAGTFDYLSVPSLEPVVVEPLLGGAAKTVAALMLAGLFVKMAVVGVHMWLPYAHAEAPTPISALLSPNLIGLAGYAAARFVASAFPGVLLSWRDALVALGFATIVYGGLVALTQVDFKRLLAYSSVSQMGYILVGVGSMTKMGIAGAMLFYLSHAVGKAILFMTAGVFIATLHGLRDIRRMGGLARLYPKTAAAALFGFLSLTGTPPAPGFWAELLILLGLLSVYGGSSGSFLLAAAALLLALSVTAAYSFITMKRVFYGRPRVEEAPRESGLMEASLVALVVAGLLVFLAANVFIGPFKDSAALNAIELAAGSAAGAG